MRRAFDYIGGADFIYRVNVALLWFLLPWTALTLPMGPLYHLAQQVWYVTFISHIALVLACLSAVASARVERKQIALEEDEQQTLKRVEKRVNGD